MAQVEPLATDLHPDDERAEKVRRFSMVVTVGMIVICNILLLFGVWVSGVNLDELVKTPDLFNSKQDICLHLTWQQVAGAAEPVPDKAIVDRMVDEALAGDLQARGKSYGLVLDVGGYYKNVITLAPSLDITYEEIDLALELIGQLLARVTRK